MHNSQPDRVVVGIGHSLGAYQALRYAVIEARRREAVLVAVRAFLCTANTQGMFQTDLLARAATAQVNRAFTDALGGLPTDVGLQILIRDGGAGPTLVSVADRETDLLIIGGGTHRRLLGPKSGIARFCVRHAMCPMLVVPPTALARSARTDRLARDTAQEVEEYLHRQTPTRRYPV